MDFLDQQSEIAESSLNFTKNGYLLMKYTLIFACEYANSL